MLPARMAARTPALRLALPPSFSNLEPARRAQVEQFVSAATSLPVELMVAASYDRLAASLLSGEINLAWAPPFACARLETAGVPILVRAVRSGQATYRAALVCQAASPLRLERLQGTRAAWVDRESTGGYLLVASLLRSRGLDLGRTFSSQNFAGSYQAALTAVVDGRADVASYYLPPAAAGDRLDLDEVLPGKQGALRSLAFTDEAPNDGIALAPFTSPAIVSALEKALLGAIGLPYGPELLQVFRAERFELAPRSGYRALYQSLRALR